MIRDYANDKLIAKLNKKKLLKKKEYELKRCKLRSYIKTIIIYFLLLGLITLLLPYCMAV